MNTKTSRPYSLRKSRHILKWVYSWYKKRGDTLPPTQLAGIESEMASLDQALINKQREPASETAKHLETFANVHCKKSVFEYIKELIIALIFALIIATIVRQVWFELYEIPTGSMRPTFREQDHLTVTKTSFGINYPLKTQHLYFDPSLVQRGSVLIFSGDGLPLPDIDTTYFGIFPYKKRFIKRLIAKPGDTIYFYGGKLYGIDSQGKDLVDLRDPPWMQDLEYVPFLSFDGQIRQERPDSILIDQMHRPVGKMSFTASGQVYGEVFNGKEWVKDQPLAQTSPHDSVKTYSDLLGIRNYAEARLLNKEELNQQVNHLEGVEEGVLYLQLYHTPSLNIPKPVLHGSGRNVTFAVPAFTSVIPLQQKHLDALMDHLYTARFVVANGVARRYMLDDNRIPPGSPNFKDVPDGTYEFYFGKATKINWGGVPSDVPKDSALYKRDPETIQKLFNLGIEMNMAYAPYLHNQTVYPHRYAYFRDGDLYLMGAPIIKKDDPLLASFHQREEQRQAKATAKMPYVAFHDYGAPLKDGQIDADFIKTFGVTIPEKQYLVLGDNHAMSADSRIFGFVPEENLQGAPVWIIWPPCDRIGCPPQNPYPFMNTPRAIIWSIAGMIAIGWYIYHRRSLRRPIFVKK